ncbi:hypothetical protein ACOMHN_046012 [Nucella lapillus]
MHVHLHLSKRDLHVLLCGWLHKRKLLSCQNGGTCLVDSTLATGYRCACRLGFTGTHCQANATCNCTGTGFMGGYCEVNEKCLPNPCSNGGLCTTNATCNCTGTGFMGGYCEVPICNHQMEVTGYTYKEVPVPGLTNRTSLVFSIQACSDAHLALSSGLNLTFSPQAVEIVIGAGLNTNQQIRGCLLSCLLSHKMETLISCNTTTTFWVSWKNTTTTTNITLGLGEEVGSGSHISANLGNYLKVKHISIASYGSIRGSWIFDFPEQVNPRPCPVTTPAVTTAMTSQPEMTTQTTTSEAHVTTETTTEPPTSTEEASTSLPGPETSTETPPVMTSEVMTSEASTSSPTSTQQTSAAAGTTTSSPVMTSSEASTSSQTSPDTASTVPPTSTSPTTTQTTSPSTSSPPPPTKPPVPKCRCRKVESSPSPTAMAKAEEAALHFKRNLTLTNSTSAQKRSKTSAHDHRPSAQTLGAVGISVLVFVLLLVMVPDLTSVGCWIYKRVFGARKNEESRKTSGALTLVGDDDRVRIPHEQHLDKRVRLRHQTLWNPVEQEELGKKTIFNKPPGIHLPTTRSNRRSHSVVSSQDEETSPASPSAVTLKPLNTPSRRRLSPQHSPSVAQSQFPAIL